MTVQDAIAPLCVGPKLIGKAVCAAESQLLLCCILLYSITVYIGFQNKNQEGIERP